MVIHTFSLCGWSILGWRWAQDFAEAWQVLCPSSPAFKSVCQIHSACTGALPVGIPRLPLPGALGRQKGALDPWGLEAQTVKSPCRRWELNPGPLQEQPVLLTAEPWLQLQPLAVFNQGCPQLGPGEPRGGDEVEARWCPQQDVVFVACGQARTC